MKRFCFIVGLALMTLGASLPPSQVVQFFGSETAAGGVPAPDADIVNWPMLEGSGTELAVTGDQTPRGVTDADWVAGLSGSGFALDFNGTDDDLYYSAAGSTVSALAYNTNQITVSMWYSAAVTNAQQSLVISGSLVTGGDGRYTIETTTEGLIHGRIRDGGGNRQETIPGPQTNVVNHLLVTFDNSTAEGNMTFYVDGQVVADTVTVNTKSGTSDFATQQLTVGNRNLSSLFFNGIIDDFRIYSGLLSAEQVLAIYNEGAQ